MAEPLTQPSSPELPKPESIVIGETPVYLTEPVAIDGNAINSFSVLSTQDRSPSGVGSAVILTKEPSRKKENRGELVDKENLNFDRMGSKNWDEVSGIRFRDEAGNTVDVPKEKLSLTPPEAESPIAEMEKADSGNPEEAVEKLSPPEKPPVLPTREARDILETLTEDPNTITIVGLKVYETRALDLADRSMQKLTSRARERAEANRGLWEKTKDAVHGIHELVFTNIWKQSVGGIYFHEKARQYYLELLKAAETPFAEDAIRLAERRAVDTYNKKLADANFIKRAGTKAIEWAKDKIGMRTIIQTLALDEMASMKADGEIKGMETFEREAKAVRARFGQDFDKADQFVRKQLGEKLEILDPENTEHAPLVTGIQSLLKQYANGDIADKAAFDKRSQEFFNATLKNVRPDIFAEAELYSSSLFDTAETLRTKMSHEAGLANIDEALSGMQIRLGLGAMGEVTSLEPTAVEKGIGKVRDIAEWLNKKHVIVPMILNEAAIGSGVAIALSALNFAKTMPARALVPIGGGALAGGIFAGWREHGQLHKDYLTHLREKESGAKFTETQKRRAWFERFSPQQRSASEMITTLQSSLYDGTGTLKTTLTDDELRVAFATVADLHARKAVSETGPKRIGLIRYSSREAIESERSALDLTANKALKDLEQYLQIPGIKEVPIPGISEQTQRVLGGNTFPEFMEKLTVTQAQVLREGTKTLEALDDPVKLTLNLVSSYAPEAEIVHRRWPFVANAPQGKPAGTEMKALGLDAIMEEFKKEARVESVKYGIKAGAIGAAVGVAIHGAGELLAHRADIGEAIGQTTQHAKEVLAPENPPPHTFTTIESATSTGPVPLTYEAPHTVTIAGTPYALPDQLDITSHAGKTFDAVFHAPQGDIHLGDHMDPATLKDTLEKAGMELSEGKGQEAIASVPIDIPGLAGRIQIPEGYHLTFVPDHHNWQLVDPDGTAVTTMRFDETGTLLGDSDEIQRITAQLARHGLASDFDHLAAIQPVAPVIPPSAAIPTESLSVTFTGPEITIHGDELGDGGVWDYYLGKTHDMSAANGMKNLFRMYVHDHPDAIDFPDGSPHEGYFDPAAHPEHLREATYGALGKVREMDLTKLPSDVEFHVPESVFGKSGIEQFLDIQKQGLADYEKWLANPDVKGPMDAIQHMYEAGGEQKVEAIVLKLGYVGLDEKLPTDPADLHLLYDKLGATFSTPPVEAGEHVEQAVRQTLHEIIITKAPEATAGGAKIIASGADGMVNLHYFTAENMAEIETRVAAAGAPEPSVHKQLYEHVLRENPPSAESAKEIPWIPVFIPYRHVLEAVGGEIVSTAPKEAALLSPFGGEDAYLTREVLGTRKSPRLTENPEAALNQQEEIAWYLSQLSPEDQQTLEALSSQENPPMNPETRAVVTVPVAQAGGNIYQRLSSYTGQTDANGAPLDSKRTEFIVYEAHVASPEGSVSETLPWESKTEVDRFLADHPDMRVLYLTHTYTDSPAVGRVKRDATNFALSRIGTLPADGADVALMSDNGTGGAIASTYIASAIDALDANPSLDIISGDYRLPDAAYTDYPMLFAQHRAFELMDALVRHGDAGNIPGVYSGNLGIRAAILAAVGGYNPEAVIAEDREISWMVREARGKADTQVILPALVATIDPKETVYTHLQQLGLAETVPLAQNEVYKDLPWTDLAAKANESYTNEHLEAHINAMYANIYPSLKASNPARFDSYFGRVMDALGISYELQNGTVKILDTTNLAANVSAPIDIEAFAKEAAPAIVESAPTAPETPREALTDFAGPAVEAAPEQSETEPLPGGVAAAETVPAQQPAAPSESPPQPEPAGAAEETLAATQPAETPTSAETIPQPETVRPAPSEKLPEGVEDRINHVLGKTPEAVAGVQLTTGELMDYIKSTVDINGTRIKDGKIVIEGNTVKLTDMKADVHLGQARLGDAYFSGTLVSDPDTGLIVDKKSLKMKLPMTLRLFSGSIHKQLDDFNNLILNHLNSRIDQHWQADRIDVVGENLRVTFAKKAA